MCVLEAATLGGHVCCQQWIHLRVPQTRGQHTMELGLYSFAENTPDPLNGNHLQSPAERLRDLIEEIELADQLGLAFYGLGEHHRPDYVASSPVTILAAAAARTKQ